ncbi:MAG: hypothetical protein N2Z74_06950, partial [Syntrophales bacterium]|nr:hypothetical protein [Syntrophales bacterium]
MDDDHGEARLKALREEIPRLRSGNCYTEAFRRWYEETDTTLAALFGPTSTPREQFQAILFTPLFLSCRCDDTLFSL